MIIFLMKTLCSAPPEEKDLLSALNQLQAFIFPEILIIHGNKYKRLLLTSQMETLLFLWGFFTGKDGKKCWQPSQKILDYYSGYVVFFQRKQERIKDRHIQWNQLQRLIRKHINNFATLSSDPKDYGSTLVIYDLRSFSSP